MEQKILHMANKIVLKFLIFIFGIIYAIINFLVTPLTLLFAFAFTTDASSQPIFTDYKEFIGLSSFYIIILLLFPQIINMISLIFGLKLLKKNNPSKKEIIFTRVLLFIHVLLFIIISAYFFIALSPFYPHFLRDSGNN